MRTLDTLDVRGKKVLVRVDFNVPLKNGKVADDTRIVAALPTIKKLFEMGADKVILISHLGRPKGERKPEYSLAPVAEELKRHFDNVVFVDDCIGEKVKEAVEGAPSRSVVLLENVRFYKEEEKGDEEFAKRLAELADCFVLDAFGTAHRNHASVAVVAKFLPSAAGLLLQKEIEFLSRVTTNPEHPFVAILGGAKVSDKIGVIKSLLEKADKVLIGGAMAYTFLKAKGVKVGASLVEEDWIEYAREVLEKAGEKIVLPVDHKYSDSFENPDYEVGKEIPEGKKGFDIGPDTVRLFKDEISKAKLVFWNGPLGVFEYPPYDEGTVEVARVVAEATQGGAVSVIGGGDSVAAVKKAGVADKITHISTGGGASLKFVEGKKLPGVEAVS